MKKVFLATAIAMLSAFSGFSQFTKVKSIELKTKAAYAAVDRVGDLYLLFADGALHKFNVDGELSATARLNAAPTLFDPRDGAHLFLYRKSTSEYEFLLPTLEPVGAPSPIDSSLAISPVLVCPSGEYDLMILDSADWSLKKFNRKTNQILYETIIFDSETIAHKPIFMREYLNFIFILDPKSGIIILNMMGKILKTISAENITYFNFLGEELYYLRGDTLEFTDLYSQETRSVKLPYTPDFALLTDQRLYLVGQNRTDIYSLN